MWIASRAGREVGELCGDRFAEHITAGCTHTRDTRGVGTRYAPGIDRRAVFGGDPCSVDHILHRNRQPRQQTEFRAQVKTARNAQGALRIDPGERAHLVFALPDCIDERMRDRLAGHLARRDHAHELRGGQTVKRRSHRLLQGRPVVGAPNLAQE